MHSKSGFTTFPNVRVRKDSCFYLGFLFIEHRKYMVYISLVLFLCFESDGRKFLSQFRI